MVKFSFKLLVSLTIIVNQNLPLFLSKMNVFKSNDKREIRISIGQK